MPTANTTVKAYRRGNKVMGARIDNGDLEDLERYLESRGMTFTQWVNEKIGEIGICGRLGISNEELDDLENIVKLSGGEFRTFFKDLYDKLDDYRIELEDGKIKMFNKE